MLLDRANRSYLAMCSVEGGMDIETLAAERPEALAKAEVNPMDGITAEKAAEIVEAAGFAEDVREDVAAVLVKLGEVYKKEDATLVEVNPLVKTGDGKILALDGKVSLDDNAEFRQPEHEALVDKSAENPSRLRPRKTTSTTSSSTVKSASSVTVQAWSCLPSTSLPTPVKITATLNPANFLDIGGGASAEVMAAGLDIILNDEQVKSVFVNVFGGITSCDAVANGIVKALEILGDKATKPLVVRLDGNNVDEGRRILSEANHPLVHQAETMDSGADKVAELAHTA